MSLDERRLAMLREMGIAVWPTRGVVPPASLPKPTSSPAAETRSAPVSAPAPEPAAATAATDEAPTVPVTEFDDGPPWEDEVSAVEELDDRAYTARERPHRPTPPGRPVSPVAPSRPPVTEFVPNPAPSRRASVLAAPAAPPAALQAPVRSAAELARIAQLDWPDLRAEVQACQACGLCATRQNTVFGVGSVQAHWMVVGEAPGEQEDLRGEPFVGAAGQLLDRMLAALKLTRQEASPGEDLLPARQVYVANTLKCRPPGNRNPAPEELAACEPFLRRQIALVQPKIILAMGRFAVQRLLRSDEPIGRLRGRVHQVEGVPVVVTYHPAYLLRNPLEKAKAWADLCLAADVVESLPGA